jgi:hypothetical protein
VITEVTPGDYQCLAGSYIFNSVASILQGDIRKFSKHLVFVGLAWDIVFRFIIEYIVVA